MITHQNKVEAWTKPKINKEVSQKAEKDPKIRQNEKVKKKNNNNKT